MSAGSAVDDGVTVGLGDGVGFAVDVGDGLGDGDELGEGVFVGDALGDALAVAVGATDGVLVGAGLGDADGPRPTNGAIGAPDPPPHPASAATNATIQKETASRRKPADRKRMSGHPSRDLRTSGRNTRAAMRA